MNLLLVLGAGASRNLGKEDRPMPLMSDWSNALCDELDKAEHGLARACRLEPGMDGPTFEENLGLLLRWQGVRHLETRFEGLTGPQVGQRMNNVPQARANTGRRLTTVMEIINSTLYEQFGQSRIDYERSSAAYSQVVSEASDCRLVVATTNYDRAVESALRHIGKPTNTGFDGPPEMTPTLKPSGMAESSAVPVIHLHGAVGWYEREGVVHDHYGDGHFNPTLGTPVVLYPDPDKDPTSDALVQQLWDEFARAIDVANLILVIGHSLHDPALVGALNVAIKDGKRVIVSYLKPDDGGRIDQVVPDAHVVEMNFGPEIRSSTSIEELIKKHAILPASQASSGTGFVPQSCHSQTPFNRPQPDSAGHALALQAVFRPSKPQVGGLSSL